MFKSFTKFYEDIKIYTYNMWVGCNDQKKIYPNMVIDDDYLNTKPMEISPDDEKNLRINTLLYIKQYKNTYYKYTNKEKFNADLYDRFIDNENFDDSLTAYDDDDPEVRIFDKYVIAYIKKRNDIVTYLQCKNKNVVIQTSLDDMRNISAEAFDILFVIDMNERDLFKYCFRILQKSGNMGMLKSIVFSMIIRYNGEDIRIKLDTMTASKNNHPYLILEKFI